MIKHVSNVQEFEESINNGLVLVDFFATWCGPCRMLSPILEELSEDPSFKPEIVKVDVDEISEVAMKFNIQAIPTMILFENGKVKNSFTGFLRKDQIIDFVNK